MVEGREKKKKRKAEIDFLCIGMLVVPYSRGKVGGSFAIIFRVRTYLLEFMLVA